MTKYQKLKIDIHSSLNEHLLQLESLYQIKVITTEIGYFDLKWLTCGIISSKISGISFTGKQIYVDYVQFVSKGWRSFSEQNTHLSKDLLWSTYFFEGFVWDCISRDRKTCLRSAKSSHAPYIRENIYVVFCRSYKFANTMYFLSEFCVESLLIDLLVQTDFRALMPSPKIAKRSWSRVFVGYQYSICKVVFLWYFFKDAIIKINP